MAQDVVVKIRAEDDFSSTINKINANFKRMSNNVDKSANKAKKSFAGLGSSAGLLKAGMLGIAGIMTGKLVGAFARAGSEVEDLTVQFTTLLGSTGAAQKRMQELTKFAQTTPFQLKGVAGASKILETLTKGTLSTGDGLRLVGDAAAASGVDFKELSVTVGRAYSGLQANRPIGEAAARLQELGLMSGETRNQIEKLQKAGQGKQAWNVLRKELEKSKGGMEAMSKTVSGLSSTLKDQLGAAMRQLLDSGAWSGTQTAMQKLVDLFNKALDKNIFAKVGVSITSGIGIAVNALTVNLYEGVKGFSALTEKFLYAKILMGTLTGASAEQIDMLQREKLSWALTKEEAARKSEEAANAAVKNFQRIKDAWGGGLEFGVVEKDTQGGGEATGQTTSSTLPDPEKEKERADALSEIRRQFADLTRTEKEIELADLDEWYAEYYDKVKGNQDNVIELTELYAGSEFEIRKRYLDLATKEEMEQAKKRADYDKMMQDRKKGYLKQGLSNLKGTLQIAGKENEKAAKAAQAIAIIETSISTAQMAVKSFNALAGVGPIGPVLGAAAAAAAIAFGAVQIAQIKSQKFAGGGVVEGNSSIGDKQMVSANAGEMFINRGQQTELFNILNSRSNQQPQSSSVNVTINGNVSEDNIQRLVEEIKMAQQEAAFLGV